VNIGIVQEAIDTGRLSAADLIDQAALRAAGISRGGKDGVRLLGKGAIRIGIRFRVAGVSAGARRAVEAAGGTVEVVEVESAAEKALKKKGLGKHHRLSRAAEHGRTKFRDEAAPYAIPLTSRERSLPRRSEEQPRSSSRGQSDGIDFLIGLRNSLAQLPHLSSDRAAAIVGNAIRVLRAANVGSGYNTHDMTPEATERVILTQEIIGDLRSMLLSEDPDVAELAGRAIALTCTDLAQDYRKIGVLSALTGDQERQVAQSLADFLFEAGDRYYSSLFLDEVAQHEDEAVIRGRYVVSRSLPVRFGGHKVVLPPEGLPEIRTPMRILVSGGVPAPTILPTPETEEAETVFAAGFEIRLPLRAADKALNLGFLVPNLVCESFEISPAELGNVPRV